MNRLLKSYSALFTSLLLCSCISPIAFEAEDKEPKLVIFGRFTDLDDDHVVSVRETGKFGNVSNAIPGALVELVDEDGNKGRYYEVGEGEYVLPRGSVEGIPGKAYKLFVILPNNSRYESSWEVMPEPVLIEKTSFDINFRKLLSESNNLIQQFFIEILIDTPLKTASGSKAYLRWETEETYSLSDLACGGLDGVTVCYFRVPNEFSQLKMFRATDDSQQKLQNHMVYSRQPSPGIEFNELHYFTIAQYSLSESTFEYWDKINVVSNPTGSIFDKIPAAVPGNFSEVDGDMEVLGYFEVSAVSVGRTLTTKYEIDQWVQIPQACLWFIPPQFQPEYCCYCFLLPNRIPKPDYWGER